MAGARGDVLARAWAAAQEGGGRLKRVCLRGSGAKVEEWDETTVKAEIDDGGARPKAATGSHWQEAIHELVIECGRGTSKDGGWNRWEMYGAL